MRPYCRFEFETPALLYFSILKSRVIFKKTTAGTNLTLCNPTNMLNKKNVQRNVLTLYVKENVKSVIPKQGAVSWCQGCRPKLQFLDIYTY